ncbi:Pentatricopeptide repeat-containing protein [Heracleum sosnowskyi]|uniref:Pentatricopeptide repeat-containing protein n=1 Tax=Heracleum sosnowskyi TaxID=360622 RepID=A0AAD8HD01_9APIA|nr:Pentatricopeptide repeat-containing protein [Heracleum sosnowskyi]
MRSIVSKSKHTLLLPLLNPRTPPLKPSLLRHCSTTPQPITTQVLTLLQNDYTTTTNQPHLLTLLSSLTPPSYLSITRQLGSTGAALKFLTFLRSHDPDPLSVSLTFQALLELASHSGSLRSEQSDIVEKLKELFKLCREGNISLTKESALLLVGFFGRARMVEEMLNVYNYVGGAARSGGLGDVVVDGLMRGGRFDVALKVFDEMLEGNVKGGVERRTVDFVFAELMRRDSRFRNVSEEGIAELVLKCGKIGVFIKGEWLCKLVIGLCRNGNLGKAWDLLHELMDLGCVDIVRSCNAILTSLERVRDFKRMNLLLQGMKDKGMQPDVVTFGILIKHLCKFHRVDEALDVYQKMVDGSEGILIRPDIILHNTLISGLCKVGRQDEGLEMMEQMKLKHGCMPTTATFNSLIDGFCKAGELDRANELFDQMNEEGILPNIITVNTLVDGFCKHGRVHTAIKFFRQMQAKGLKGNVKTYTSLLNAFYNSNNIEKSAELFDEMLDTGCSPDAKVYYTMISGLTNAGRLDDASFIVLKMKEAGFHLDTVAYNVLIGGFCRRKRFDKAVELLADMEENNVNPDNVTYNTLISHFSENGDFKTAHKVMKKMVHDGIVPTVVTYGALIHAYCLAGNLDEAERLFRSMCSTSSIPPNNVIYNILINSLCKNGKVDGALSLMNDMKVKGVKPNTNTFNAMFKGLYDKNWLDEALKLMDQMTQQACNPDYITMEILTDWLSAVGETEKLQKFVEGCKVSGLSSEQVSSESS